MKSLSISSNLGKGEVGVAAEYFFFFLNKIFSFTVLYNQSRYLMFLITAFSLDVRIRKIKILSQL